MRIASASGVVSAILWSCTARASAAVTSSSCLTVQSRLGLGSNAVTRSSGPDPHTLTLDSIPNRNDRARISSNPGFCRGFARQESLTR